MLKSSKLNYFENRATNAAIESFHSKLKLFRQRTIGIVDKNFFCKNKETNRYKNYQERFVKRNTVALKNIYLVLQFSDTASNHCKTSDNMQHE